MTKPEPREKSDTGGEWPSSRRTTVHARTFIGTRSLEEAWGRRAELVR